MTVETDQRSWDVHRYRPGDERELLDLFESVFGFRRSLDHWSWQFGRNPYGGPFITTARRRADGRLVGGHVLMPFPLNVKGRQVTACQSLDLMVHADYRKQGIFETTAAECLQWCRSAGVVAAVAFPNAASYPGFVRSLGWNRLVVPRRFSRLISIEVPLRRVVRFRAAARLLDDLFQIGLRASESVRALGEPKPPETWRLGISESLPPEYDGLWERWRSHQVLSIWKDSAYLHWRYGRHPDRTFTYLHLSDGREMLALAIVAEVKDVAILCEFIVRDWNARAGRWLGLETCRHFSARGSRALRFLAHDAGLVRESLPWFRETVAYENVFVGRALDDPELDALMAIPENWTLAYGDGDFV